MSSLTILTNNPFTLTKGSIQNLIKEGSLLKVKTSQITGNVRKKDKVGTSLPEQFSKSPSFIKGEETYFLSTELTEQLIQLAWSQLFDLSVIVASKLSFQLECNIDLEIIEDKKVDLIQLNAMIAGDLISETPWIERTNITITGNVRKIVRTYVYQNVEHNIAAWQTGFQAFYLIDFAAPSKVYGYYLHFLYLKWRLLNLKADVLHEDEAPFADIILSLIKPESKANKSETLDDAIEVEQTKINRREVILLLYFIETRKPFLSKLSGVNDINYQLIGILTGNQAKSFANLASRTLKIGENKQDKMYLQNLYDKLTDTSLSQSFKDEFAVIISDIKTALDKLKT